MIYTVTLNPSLDYNITVNNFQTGRLNKIENNYILPGGKGINVAKVLHNLGQPVIAMGFLAGFTGAEIASLLASEGLRSQFVSLNKGMTRINIKLRSQEETEINGNGPEISDEDFQALMNGLAQIRDGDFLVLSGSVPSSHHDNLYASIIRKIGDRKVNVVIDARKELLSDCLRYKPFLIKPNNDELGELFGVTITDHETLWHYSRKLRELGARNVLVSLSRDGAFFIGEDDNVYEIHAPQGRLINSVGAGDSMVAGFITGYLESSGNIVHTLKMAAAAGSASAFSKGLATKEEVSALIGRVEVIRK